VLIAHATPIVRVAAKLPPKSAILAYLMRNLFYMPIGRWRFRSIEDIPPTRRSLEH
jgi:hypothetical protein